VLNHSRSASTSQAATGFTLVGGVNINSFLCHGQLKLRLCPGYPPLNLPGAALQFISQVQRLVKLAGEAYIDPADLKRVRTPPATLTAVCDTSGPGCFRRFFHSF